MNIDLTGYTALGSGASCGTGREIARTLGRQMIDLGLGKFVFVASVLWFRGGANLPGYAAGKGVVAQLTRAFANEWAAHGVNVNAVAPRYVDTETTPALNEGHDQSSAMIARMPVGRWGKPADIVGPVFFPSSELSDFVHGAIPPADDGRHARLNRPGTNLRRWSV